MRARGPSKLGPYGPVVIPLMIAILLGAAPPGHVVPAPPKKPLVVLQTSLGDLTLELWPDRAPRTVEGFLRLVKDGHYDGTIFHRVVREFMVQGGGYTAERAEKAVGTPVPLDPGASNRRFTVAMAGEVGSAAATGQFFINLLDNEFLDPGRRGHGFAVFGSVIDGRGVLARIAESPVQAVDGFPHLPVTPIVIKKAFVVP